MTPVRGRLALAYQEIALPFADLRPGTAAQGHDGQGQVRGRTGPAAAEGIGT